MIIRCLQITSRPIFRPFMHIKIDHVTKRFGRVTALDDVSLAIEPGQVVALVGANGAGKTTLLRALGAVVVPTAGEIRFDGELFRRDRLDLRRRLGFLPDFPFFFPGSTVLAHIGMALRLYDAVRPGIEQRVLDLLKRFDILPLAETPMSKLSRGQAYKAALVAHLAVDPELWLFDEPFASGMDPLGIAALRALAWEAIDRGRTVIYSTQILEAAERFADRVAVIHRGRLRAFGSIDSLRHAESEDGEVLAEILAALHEEGR